MSKTIVITGAGAGLGRALARRFVADGHNVVLLGRTPAKIQAVAAELGERAMAVTCDVGSAESVKAAFAAIAKRHKRIDVLINNAAIFPPVLIAEATDDQILRSVATNLTGPILCARAAIPLMDRGSHIINVSSESVKMLFPHLTLYQCTKAGLERFSRALYHELEPSGIRVTMVRAGQMFDAEKMNDPEQAALADPATMERFRVALLGAGIDLMTRPISQYASAVEVFRTLIDLPPDIHTVEVALHSRAPN